MKKEIDRKQERLLHEKDALTNIQFEQTKGVIGYFYRMYIKDSRNFALRFKDKTILDIGAGDGIVLENSELNPIEMDISLERCRRLRQKQRMVICGSGFEIPIQDNSIDCALLIAILEHTSNPEKVIDEVYRILKKGGQAAILVPNDITLSVGRILLFKFPPRYPGHISFITPKKLKIWLKGKFKIIQEYNLPFPKATFWISLYYFVFIRKTEND
jgi:ubiquinone/menaquinone biosynthesis C-methylase UbiE